MVRLVVESNWLSGDRKWLTRVEKMYGGYSKQTPRFVRANKPSE